MKPLAVGFVRAIPFLSFVAAVLAAGCGRTSVDLMGIQPPELDAPEGPTSYAAVVRVFADGTALLDDRRFDLQTSTGKTGMTGALEGVAKSMAHEHLLHDIESGPLIPAESLLLVADRRCAFGSVRTLLDLAAGVQIWKILIMGSGGVIVPQELPRRIGAHAHTSEPPSPIVWVDESPSRHWIESIKKPDHRGRLPHVWTDDRERYTRAAWDPWYDTRTLVVQGDEELIERVRGTEGSDERRAFVLAHERCTWESVAQTIQVLASSGVHVSLFVEKWRIDAYAPGE